MDPFVLALIFSVVVIGGTYIFALRLSKGTVKKMNLRLKELADELGLQVPEPTPKPALSAFYSAELSGEVKGRAFYFTNFTRSAEKSASYITEFSWACNRRDDHTRIIITKEGIVSTFQKQFGVKDIITGDKEFDNNFLIRCDDEDYALKVLSPKIRAEILKWRRNWYGALVIHHKEVHYEETGVLVEEKDLSRMLRMIEVGRFVANELETME